MREFYAYCCRKFKPLEERRPGRGLGRDMCNDCADARAARLKAAREKQEALRS